MGSSKSKAVSVAQSNFNQSIKQSCTAKQNVDQTITNSITLNNCNKVAIKATNESKLSFDCDLKSSVDAAVAAAAKTATEAGSNLIPFSKTESESFSQSITDVRIKIETECGNEVKAAQRQVNKLDCKDSNDVDLQFTNSFGSTTRCASDTLVKVVADAEATATAKSGDTGLIIMIVIAVVIGGVIIAIVKMSGKKPETPPVAGAGAADAAAAAAGAGAGAGTVAARV